MPAFWRPNCMTWDAGQPPFARIRFVPVAADQSLAKRSGTKFGSRPEVAGGDNKEQHSNAQVNRDRSSKHTNTGHENGEAIAHISPLVETRVCHFAKRIGYIQYFIDHSLVTILSPLKRGYISLYCMDSTVSLR